MKQCFKGLKELIEELANGKNFLLDGGVGTEIQRKGVKTPLPLWSAKALITNPEVVRQIHTEYISAGADIIKTNTFRSNKRTLAKGGYGDKAEELTRLAVELSKEAAACFSRKVYIGGSCGPLEDCYNPDIVPHKNALIAEHTEHITNLAKAGVDFIAIETINTILEAETCLKSAMDVGIPAWISFVGNENGSLLSGESIADAVKAVEPLKPFAILLNCIPPRTASIPLKLLRSATNLPIGIYCNDIGKACDKDGWAFESFDFPVEEYTKLADGWKKDGAQLLGTCCGTTPEYTAALKKNLW